MNDTLALKDEAATTLLEPNSDLSETLFAEFVRETRRRKQGQRGAFKAALRQYAGATLAGLSDKDPVVLIASSPVADARALDKIVHVQFLDPDSPWSKFAQFMEVNIHSMVNRDYEVDRVYWNFPAGAYELCNEFIRFVYQSVGTQFQAVFILEALDHKQVSSGIIADLDVHVDRERGERQVRVMVDLANPVTTHHSGGELAGVPDAPSLVDILAESHRQTLDEDHD